MLLTTQITNYLFHSSFFKKVLEFFCIGNIRYVIDCLLTMASKRCFFAECCDQVVCNSETTWMPLSEVKNKDLGQTCFPEAQTLLEVMLLRADLFFQHILDLDNAVVCDAHYTMLVQPFYVMTESMCDTCVDVRGSQLRNKGRLRNINVSQAITLCEIFKVKHSYGKVICPRCRIELGKYGDITRKELHNDAFTCLLILNVRTV